MKGADTVMSSIVQYNDWLEEEVMPLGRDGLTSILICCGQHWAIQATLSSVKQQDTSETNTVLNPVIN